MATQPRPSEAGRSLGEWVVLAILDEAPAHGFAIARDLEPATDLGRILTLRRTQVYRAIDRLGGAGLVTTDHVEPGAGGPDRTIQRTTEAGRRAVAAWLEEPVGHVRELRVEFLIKLRLLERRGLDRAGLVAAQREVLLPTIDRLVRPGTNEPADVVDRWRAHTARAARDFLDALASS